MAEHISPGKDRARFSVLCQSHSALVSPTLRNGTRPRAQYSYPRYANWKSFRVPPNRDKSLDIDLQYLKHPQALQSEQKMTSTSIQKFSTSCEMKQTI